MSAAGGFTFPQDAPNGFTVTLDDAATADTTYGANLGTSGATGDSGSVTVKPAELRQQYHKWGDKRHVPLSRSQLLKGGANGFGHADLDLGGTNPNGTWKFYVTTDVWRCWRHRRAIDGWSLNITTNPGPVVTAGGSVTFTKAARPSLSTPGSP